MTVTIFTNLSENNVINKKLIDKKTANCVLKSDASIMNPNIILDNFDFSDCNYMYIPEFKRYYFINNITALTGGRLSISGSVDVLESFKEDILKLKGVVISREYGGNNYLPNSKSWVSNVKTFTEIKNFPVGFNESGSFILITAG